MAILNSPTTFPSISSIARPAYNTPTNVAGFGTKVTRIGGDTGAAMTGISGTWGADARHHYSKDQPWNDDMTMIKLENSGTPGQLIIDANTYQPIISSEGGTKSSALLKASEECRWRPGHPREMISWNKSKQTIIHWDVLDGREIWSAHIGSGDPNFGFQGEGAISDNGRWLVLSTAYPSPQTSGKIDSFVIVDIAARFVGYPNPFLMPVRCADGGKIDWAGISPLGKYVIVKYSDHDRAEYARVFHRGGGAELDINQVQCSSHTMDVNGLRMGDGLGSTKSDTRGWIAWMSHADFNVMPDGVTEVLVGGVRGEDNSNTCTGAAVKAKGRVIAVDLATGLHTHIAAGTELLGAEAADDEHGSGRAYRKRGWHFMSYSSEVAGKKYFDEIVAWKLDGSHECLRFGPTRTTGTPYRMEAHPCPSPDGTKVMFASNWAGPYANPLATASDTKAYVVEAQ